MIALDRHTFPGILKKSTNQTLCYSNAYIASNIYFVATFFTKQENYVKVEKEALGDPHFNIKLNKDWYNERITISY